MIYDRNDNLAADYIVNYQPIQSAPHPDTPVYVDGAECGAAESIQSWSMPQYGLCARGAPGQVESQNGLYQWTCTANLTEITASCSANGKSVTGLNQVFISSANVTNPWGWSLTKAAASELSVAPPVGKRLPWGLIAIDLDGGLVGSSAAVTLRFPEALPENAVYMKYGKSPEGYGCQGQACMDDHWYQVPQTVSEDRRAVTIYLTDGGAGDSDMQPNSKIVDPGGVVAPLASTAPSLQPVPTLSHTGLLLLSLLLAGGWALVARMRGTC